MEHESLRFPDVPRAELETTISDLITQAQRVLTVQGRLRALLQAYRAVIEELDLDRVLSRIVEAAASLVGAEYAALGVIDPRGQLERFLHVGIPPEHVGLIGHLPEGRGLLGAVIDVAESIRLEHLGDDPRSVGFPEYHPPMDAFLGVPVRVRDQVFGNLYLTNPRAGTFTEEDEELIESLASIAGIAIENARLYDEARRQERMSTAQSEVRAALLSPDTVDVLGVVAERVASVVPVELVMIMVPIGSDDEMRVDAARGPDADRLAGIVLPADSTPAGRAMSAGSLIADEAWALPDRGIQLGPTAAVPLVTAGRAIGALCVSRSLGGGAFTHPELSAISEFAAQAGIALTLARARQDREGLEVIEERSRIARDLHDHVIQRLFATGLGLQALASADPAHAVELDGRVSEIDAAIADIRTAIFTLRGRHSSTVLARHRLLDVVSELAAALSFTPRITFTGPVDLVLRDSLADDVVAVVRESLANVARHANAATSAVAVVVTDSEVVVSVEDDGDGADPDARGKGGTANLAQRAAGRGGTYTLARLAERGTRAQWRVPIEA
jgi:signal transduction histidine kinase